MHACEKGCFVVMHCVLCLSDAEVSVSRAFMFKHTVKFRK